MITAPETHFALDRALFRDADDTVTPDRNGSEWMVEPQYTRTPIVQSPLAADIPGADTSNWSSAPRPVVTAWEGADIDAFWMDNGVWRHCQTGEAWEPAHRARAAKHTGSAINFIHGALAVERSTPAVAGEAA